MRENKFNISTRKQSQCFTGETLDNKKYIFEDISLTHSRFFSCVLSEINFKRAAVTGTIFEHCILKNCNFDDADFEFCEFRHCTIAMEKTHGCSFNNSNFFECIIQNTNYTSCTFTGTFFEQTSILNVVMSYSTLEGACFSNCKFENLDWRELNLEYVEFINPSMNNVVLPFFQIPYIFGILHYLSITQDNVKIATEKTNITIDTFFEEGIPYLLREYEKDHQNFPMSNILLFGRNTDYNAAFHYLSDEVSTLSFSRDFRGIKFCCKLISSSGICNKQQLNRLYKLITNADISIRPNSSEMKSFTRNIGEIREMLFNRIKVPTLSIQIKANIGIEYSMRFANLLHQFQKIAKPNHSGQLNTSIKLSQNSPLLIDVIIEGDVTYFASILYSFLVITGVKSSDCLSYPLMKSLLLHNSDCSVRMQDIYKNSNELCEVLKYDGITLTLINYHVKYCDEMLAPDDKHYYIQNNLAATPTGDS